MRTDKEIILDIENIIEKQIQPSVAMHGGVVSLHSYNDGVAIMFMSGACSGCASYLKSRYRKYVNTLCCRSYISRRCR